MMAAAKKALTCGEDRIGKNAHGFQEEKLFIRKKKTVVDEYQGQIMTTSYVVLYCMRWMRNRKWAHVKKVEFLLQH